MIYKIYTFLFARVIFFKLNRFLYKLSIHGLGIRNNTNSYLSGEDNFIKRLIKNQGLKNGVIFDVGANIGTYSKHIRNQGVKLPIYAFEPHPDTYLELLNTANEFDITSINSGLGKETSKSLIFDYKSNDGSQHASLFKEVIEEIHKSESITKEINITTIDVFVKSNKIDEIALLKIDTEGNELAVLEGAIETLNLGKIKVIQIEFNEMNVISHTFMRDFIKILPNYNFYRLLPNEMLELKEYIPVYNEIFAFQNIIAILK